MLLSNTSRGWFHPNRLHLYVSRHLTPAAFEFYFILRKCLPLLRREPGQNKQFLITYNWVITKFFPLLSSSRVVWLIYDLILEFATLFCFVFFLFVIFSLLKKLSRLSHSVSCFLCMIKFFKFWSICVLWLSLCEVKIWSVIIQQHSTTRKKKKIAYFLFCWFLHQLISLSLQCYWRMLLRNKTVSWSLWSQSCRGHSHDIPLAFLSPFFLSPRGDVSLNFVIRLSYTLNRSWNTLVGYLKS